MALNRALTAKKGSIYPVKEGIGPKTSESFETPVVPFDSNN